MSFLQYPKYLRKNILLFFVLALLLSTAVMAEEKLIQSTDAQLRLQWYGDHVALKEVSLLKNMQWQFLGPKNISGRMTDVDVVTPKGKNYVIYVAGATGGVWKTENEGVTWEPIFQHAASTAIGDITLAPSNPDIIWIGTGEANIFRSSNAGIGVFKSTDAGKTWKHMGLTGTYTIPRIVIHPTNPDIVYVAASGHEWTNNVDRGVYKTTDGGTTWEKVFYDNEKTGAIDLVMDPTHPDTLYMSTWQRIRLKWNDPRNKADYTGSGIYKTTDGGATWKPINNGLTEAKNRGRIGIDLCAAKPNVLYAFIDNYEFAGKNESEETDSYGRPSRDRIKGSTIYRSDDGGENWRKTSVDSTYMEDLPGTYGWVFGQIKVDPVNENRIYVMGLGLNISEDGGKTFRELVGMHGDLHGLWIDPANTSYLVNVNDGGVVVSYDMGKNWRVFTDNVPLVQLFTIMVDLAQPFHVYASIQDHGSYRGVVDLSQGRNDIPAQVWETAPGGEGSRHAIDPTDENIVYSAGFYGSIMRTDFKANKTELIVPKPPKGEPPYRGQWLAPFIISSHNPRILYLGLNYLFRSMNRGESWERISPDLSYNDPNKKGDIQYQTLFTISESPLKFGLIYAGTDDGRVHVTKDSGLTWTEMTKGLPYGKWVSRIEASAYDLGTVYMTQNGKRDDDFVAYVWKSTDYGKTWHSITGNIPSGPVNVIREDPKNKNLLYVGTDIGVYATLNGGKTWHVLAGNFPTTYVHDLIVHPRDNILLAATHGRGAWAMDVSYLQQMTDELLAKKVHLFSIANATLPILEWWGYAGGQKAYCHYYLKETQPVLVTVKNAAGKIVQVIKATGDAGINTIIWDLQAMEDKDAKEKPKTPYVEPGKYTVILTAGTETLESNLDVLK